MTVVHDNDSIKIKRTASLENDRQLAMEAEKTELTINEPKVEQRKCDRASFFFLSHV